MNTLAHKTLEKKSKLNSLRQRTLLFSAATGLIVLAISVIVYYQQGQTHQQVAYGSLERKQLQNKLDFISHTLLESYRELNHFLLKPKLTIHRTNVDEKIDAISTVIDELSTYSWIRQFQDGDGITSMQAAISKLKQDTEELFDARVDVLIQFPSLNVAANVMGSSRTQIESLFAVVVEQLDTENTILSNPGLYQEVMRARYFWQQALSNQRIYLTNRFGSFDDAAIPAQEQSILVLFEEMKTRLVDILQRGEEVLGFEVYYAIEELLAYSEEWISGFHKIVKIHQSGEWRIDVLILQEKIDPTIDRILELVAQYEKLISTSIEDDFESLSQLAHFQNSLLWTVSAIGLLLIAVIVFSLDRLVFLPIAQVSNALKSVAQGKTGEIVFAGQFRETQDLINAFSEMSEQVNQRQSELEYRALHDSLTSLPNRTLLFDRISHDISIAERRGSQLSLLLLDLDHFKEINDTLGHHVGDLLLVEVGNRIRNRLRAVDTVARLGGDEFSILLPDANEEHALVTAEKVTTELENPFTLDGVEIFVQASIGIATYPKNGNDSNSLLRYADIAMYAAKKSQIRYQLYDKEIDDFTLSRLTLKNELRDAIASNGLDIHYQPIIDFDSSKAVMMEALLRWDHAEHGYIFPEHFIKLAEQTGLINSLTYWVLDHVIKQLSQWHQDGYMTSIAINLSVYNFRDDNLLHKTCEMLQTHKVPARYLTFEITESAMIENPTRTIDMINELHKLGIRIAIDDFGTGFSSMAYLQQLPVDELKIDKAFVLNLDKDSDKVAIVRSTIDLAHNLGLKVTAEGIETLKVSNLLKSMDCDKAQGYYFGVPKPVDELTRDQIETAAENNFAVPRDNATN